MIVSEVGQLAVPHSGVTDARVHKEHRATRARILMVKEHELTLHLTVWEKQHPSPISALPSALMVDPLA